ncbi:MAG: tautomerase family protein, partial [Lachnospiraceae bacterium]|nr:tautomerase family protein [Lachnospiraceae bacterium]
MPLIEVNILKGKKPEYKKTLMECIHKGLVGSISIEDWDDFQRINEYDEENFQKPSFKSDDFTIIELTIFPGRSKEQKRKMIEMITENLNKSLSIDPQDVFITIIEPPLENWGMGGKQKE